MKRGQLGLFLCLFSSLLSAQVSFHISKPSLAFENNILTINYDITGCGRSEFFDINVIILNSKGDTLQPRFITGDIGLMISCGTGKSIEWNLEKDNYKINDNIQVLIKGVRSAPVVVNDGPSKYSRSNIVFSSALLPGWGQKKATGKPVWLALGGLFLGSAGASVYYALQTPGLEQEYLKASDELRDEKFGKWQDQYKLSRTLAIGAGGLWLGNLILSAVIPVSTVRDMKVGLSSDDNCLLITAKWNF